MGKYDYVRHYWLGFTFSILACMWLMTPLLVIATFREGYLGLGAVSLGGIIVFLVGFIYFRKAVKRLGKKK